MGRDLDRPIWGWDGPVRVALIAIVATLALPLAWAAPQKGAPSQRLPALQADANRAPEAVLGALPGLGPALSRRIVEGRSDGPYASIDDLDRRVRGIGPAKARALTPHLLFDPTADAVTR
ncbi:ComEA family DNA-binding protein [Tundrisphaera sp. TA3]|uniref:ComEA family DNA-binding protein n=1 Tax=Tundrisphaera sp. TA3 TaxID=3435775 RepID=UPI003EC02194